MRKTKQFLSLALTLSLLPSLATVPVLALNTTLQTEEASLLENSTQITIKNQTLRAASNAFTDVPAGYWAANAIRWASANGYMNGASKSKFLPNGKMTRQAMWMSMARLSGEKPSSTQDACIWAINNQISDGTHATSNMSRQQLVTYLYRYCLAKGYPVSGSQSLATFSDYGTVASYAQDSLSWAVGNGLISGKSSDTLAPSGTATRAQFAVILQRFCQNILHQDTSVIPETTNTGSDSYMFYREVIQQRESEWGVGKKVVQSHTSLQGVPIIRLLDMNNDGIDELVLGYDKLSENPSFVDDSHAEVWTYNGNQAVKIFDKEGPISDRGGNVWVGLSYIDGEWLMGYGLCGGRIDLEYWGIRNGTMSIVHTLHTQIDAKEKDGKKISESAFSAIYKEWSSQEIRSSFNYLENGRGYGQIEDFDTTLARTMEARKQLGM